MTSPSAWASQLSPRRGPVRRLHGRGHGFLARRGRPGFGDVGVRPGRVLRRQCARAVRAVLVTIAIVRAGHVAYCRPMFKAHAVEE
jgi:hypothetical protein